MKLIYLFLFVLVTSCSSSYVYLDRPIPQMRTSQKTLKSTILGTYKVTNSILDSNFLTVLNELYNPLIKIDSDTAIFFTGNMEVLVSKDLITMKKNMTIYTSKTYYDSNFSEKDRTQIDTILFNHDLVKIITKETIDTLIDISSLDVIKKHKGNYVLNKHVEEGYQPIFLMIENESKLQIMDLHREDLFEYYSGFRTEKMMNKAEDVDNGNTIKLTNSELRYLIKNDHLKNRFHLVKK